MGTERKEVKLRSKAVVLRELEQIIFEVLQGTREKTRGSLGDYYSVIIERTLFNEGCALGLLEPARYPGVPEIDGMARFKGYWLGADANG